MRLLSVIHGPTWGGAHNQAATLAPSLRRLGVETIVLLPSEAEEAGERLERAGVEAIRVGLSRPRATRDPRPNLRLARRTPGEIRALERLIRERGVDVVQVHGPTNPQAAIAARRVDGTAIVWQILDSRTPRPLVRLTMPYVVRSADVITTWGETLADLHPPARSLGPRLLAVYPPVPSGRFDPDPERRAAARERLGITGEEPVVGTVGVLTPQKGHEDLIAAIAILGATGGAPPTRLIGSPSAAHPAYVAELRAAASRARAEMRFEPGDDVAALLPGLDVFALASVARSEGMPTAILEAMLAAKPVVATDVGAVRELVADGETAILVPPGAPERLAEAIGRLAADPELRARMGAAGRDRARRLFGLDRLATLHHRAYELALTHRRGG